MHKRDFLRTVGGAATASLFRGHHGAGRAVDVAIYTTTDELDELVLAIREIAGR